VYMKFLFLLALVPFVALAADGGVDSGGGKSVVCRDDLGQIASAQLLDLYEGRILFGRNPQQSNDSYAVQAAHAALQFRDHLNGEFAYLDQMEERVKTIFTPTSLLPPGVELGPTSDSVQVILPRGCELEQVAVFNTRLNRLMVSSDIWSKFDETNRAALLVHEALYDILRRYADEKDSFYTRQLVSLVMAEGQLPSPLYGLPTGAYLCGTGDSDLPSTKFFLSPLEDGAIEIQWISLNKLPILVPTKDVIRGINGRFTFQQLVGQAPIKQNDLYASWKFNVGENALVSPGWSQEMRVAVIKGQKIVTYFGAYRPGQSGAQPGSLMYMTCKKW